MMLKMWLAPSEIDTPDNVKSFFNASLTDQISDYQDLGRPDVVLIGFDRTLCEQVRTHLYRFHNHFRNIRIADLGNFLQENVDFATPLLSELISNKTIPVIVGADTSLMESMINAAQSAVTVISNRIEEVASFGTVPINYLAFQRHLVPYNVLGSLDDNCMMALSLGKIRTHPNLLEPFLRDCGLLCLDLNAVRSSEVPHISDACPSGLTTEELCQTMKFAGMSSRLEAVLIKAKCCPESHNEAKVIAEAIWYLLEGLNMSTNDHPKDQTPCKEFLVTIPDLDTDLTFVRSELSGKWWLKVDDHPENEVLYIACAHEEYQQAVSGHELPERLAKFILH